MASRVISRAAERAMKTWVAKVDASRQLRVDEGALPQKGPYVVISREAGLPTTQIAHDVAVELDWVALDHELLDELAERYHAPVQLMELMDEQPAHWLSDALSQGIAHHKWSPQTFVHRAARIIQLAGHNGRCVIVGRGAQYILPSENGLFVRLIGSKNYRAQFVAQRDNVSLAEAMAKVAEIDKQREGFVRQYFHHDVADLHQYDLVINVEKLGSANAVQFIVGAISSVANDSRAEKEA